MQHRYLIHRCNAIISYFSFFVGLLIVCYVGFPQLSHLLPYHLTTAPVRYTPRRFLFCTQHQRRTHYHSEPAVPSPSTVARSASNIASAPIPLCSHRSLSLYPSYCSRMSHSCPRLHAPSFPAPATAYPRQGGMQINGYTGAGPPKIRANFENPGENSREGWGAERSGTGEGEAGSRQSTTRFHLCWFNINFVFACAKPTGAPVAFWASRGWGGWAGVDLRTRANSDDQHHLYSSLLVFSLLLRSLKDNLRHCFRSNRIDV
ncbi:hypothetical protein R5R35_001969 [Gryllus longicercus]|uniref:Uncharacterized protein n=1 Tax=Gryllus longicercus TaxID=2509291 RepID=A0AAN9VYA1_9ORTH